MVADVRTLDKVHGGIKAAYMVSAVKQDLIISAYKPARIFENRFLQSGGSVDAAWDFTRQHLEKLPRQRGAEPGRLLGDEGHPHGRVAGE